MVHPGGRPRTVSPPPDECIELGKEYIKWLLDNPEALHHTEWYSIHKQMLNSEWRTIRYAPEFLPYYEQGRHILAQRMRKAQVVREGIAHRYLSLLDCELKEHEKELVEHKANTASKAEIETQLTLAQIAKKAESGELSQK